MPVSLLAVIGQQPDLNRSDRRPRRHRRDRRTVETGSPLQQLDQQMGDAIRFEHAERRRKIEERKQKKQKKKKRKRRQQQDNS